jgi:hypothetical protein
MDLRLNYTRNLKTVQEWREYRNDQAFIRKAVATVIGVCGFLVAMLGWAS